MAFYPGSETVHHFTAWKINGRSCYRDWWFNRRGGGHQMRVYHLLMQGVAPVRSPK
jgi:hypothetical protein